MCCHIVAAVCQKTISIPRRQLAWKGGRFVWHKGQFKVALITRHNRVRINCGASWRETSELAKHATVRAVSIGRMSWINSGHNGRNLDRRTSMKYIFARHSARGFCARGEWKVLPLRHYWCCGRALMEMRSLDNGGARKLENLLRLQSESWLCCVYFLWEYKRWPL